MTADDRSDYYAGMAPTWAANYPSTTALADAWAFYRECGYDDPEARLREPLGKVEWQSHRLLDFGCDTGVMLAFFEQAVPGAALYGLDINADALQEGRRRFPQFNLVQYDGAGIPFRDDYFDLIFASAVLKHIRYEDRDAVYADFRRVARYLYVVEEYREQQEISEAHGFRFYRSNFREELSARFAEIAFSRVGGDFLGLYRLD